MAANVLGCRASWSRLNEPLGIPVSFECTVEGEAEVYGDLEALAGKAAQALSALLGGRLRLGILEGWEFLGGRFNLYTFSLNSGGSRAGLLRVVESGGYPLGVYGVLTSQAAPPASGPGWRVESGQNLAGINLRKPPEEPEAEKGVPLGQKFISKMVVYAVEGVPRLDPSKWRLRVEGHVRRPATYALEDLSEGPSGVDGDFHCVTGWSVRGKKWEGVPLRDLLTASKPKPGAQWLAAVSAGGYSTIMPLDEALDGLLVLRVDGEPLPPEHGFPARLYLPRLYGWKHAKWVTQLVVMESYSDGYWEALAYHERGLAILQERFKIRNPTVAKAGRLLGRPRKLRPASTRAG